MVNRVVSCACLFALPIAGCGENVVDAARAGCIDELQAISGLSTGGKTAKFDRVPNSINDKARFEFAWSGRQIFGVGSGVVVAEAKISGNPIARSPRRAPCRDIRRANWTLSAAARLRAEQSKKFRAAPPGGVGHLTKSKY